jgi:hypothetical protein
VFFGILMLAVVLAARTIHDEHSMRALLNVATDLVYMELHGLGVGERQCASGADPMRQADCTGQKCTLLALIGGLTGPHAAPAHCRTVPFFWPMRASSWNHSSTFVRGGRSQRCAFSVRGHFF